MVAAFATGRPMKRLGVVMAGALGGAFPDIDAVSMWSRFDSTIGRLFGLSHSGRVIYGEKFWYSHHAFFHSIVAALLFAVLLGLVGYGIYRLINRKSPHTLVSYFKVNIFVAIAFVAGCVAHLLGDMPTPASVWGGVNMFWPSSEYIGGSGKIWWWNNYDIFLLVFLCTTVNGLLLFILKKRTKRIVGTMVAMFTFLLVTVQVNTRQYSYAYSGNTPHYQDLEKHSKEEQERILGKRLYRSMEWLDSYLPIHF